MSAGRRPGAAGGSAGPGPATGDLFERALPRPWSVGELTRALRNAVEPKFRDVWVAGEVANLRRQASGHVYFSLKDDEATIGAVLWASQARRMKFELAEGQQVLARGFVEIYPPHGKYQLVAQEIEPRGAGALAVMLQQVKERLQADGLLDPARKRALPFLPRRVGVATSPTGAALRDFLRVLHARFPSLPVLVAPCRVQGEGAAATVSSAVRALCRRRRGRHRRHARRRLAGGPRRVQRRAARAGARRLPGAGGVRRRPRDGRHGRRPRRRRRAPPPRRTPPSSSRR